MRDDLVDAGLCPPRTGCLDVCRLAPGAPRQRGRPPKRHAHVGAPAATSSGARSRAAGPASGAAGVDVVLGSG